MRNTIEKRTPPGERCTFHFIGLRFGMRSPMCSASCGGIMIRSTAPMPMQGCGPKGGLSGPSRVTPIGMSLNSSGTLTSGCKSFTRKSLILEYSRARRILLGSGESPS